jgi:serine/threonine-protein kinase RsbW
MGPMTISLSIPGDAGHLAVLRATVSSVAARAHLTLDQVDDVRLAVEEAASALLQHRPRQIDLTVDPTSHPLEVVISAETDTPVEMDRNGFSWTILSAMTDDVEFSLDGPRTLLRLRFTSPVPVN